jgi:hypothetical protein
MMKTFTAQITDKDGNDLAISLREDGLLRVIAFNDDHFSDNICPTKFPMKEDLTQEEFQKAVETEFLPLWETIQELLKETL